MGKQEDQAKRLNMFQPDISTWRKRIAEDLQSCLKLTPAKIIADDGYEIKLVKRKNQR